MTDRLFTPRSARRWIHEIGPVAEQVCRLYSCLERLGRGRIHTDAPVDRAYFDRLLVLGEALRTIRRTGARVRDLRRGVFGFPARLEGRPVWLCWRVGEPTLAYWRETGASLDGRRLVDENGPWDDGPPAG